jgi:hypothetical protein
MSEKRENFLLTATFPAVWIAGQLRQAFIDSDRCSGRMAHEVGFGGGLVGVPVQPRA